MVADDGWEGDGLNLGALAVAGPEVLLLFARCAHPPQACGPPSTLLLRSRDGGRSWGPPQNLSDVVGGEVFAPGPGSGIQVRGGVWGGGLGVLEGSEPPPWPLPRSSGRRSGGAWCSAGTGRWSATGSRCC